MIKMSCLFQARFFLLVAVNFLEKLPFTWFFPLKNFGLPLKLICRREFEWVMSPFWGPLWKPKWRMTPFRLFLEVYAKDPLHQNQNSGSRPGVCILSNTMCLSLPGNFDTPWSLNTNAWKDLNVFICTNTSIPGKPVFWIQRWVVSIWAKASGSLRNNQFLWLMAVGTGKHTAPSLTRKAAQETQALMSKMTTHAGLTMVHRHRGVAYWSMPSRLFLYLKILPWHWRSVPKDVCSRCKFHKSQTQGFIH